jgi:hypothetical protein
MLRSVRSEQDPYSGPHPDSGFRNTGSFKDSLNARENKIIVDKTKKYENQMEGAFINFNTAIHSNSLNFAYVPIFVYIKE